jgi:site-specific DNA recombinase
LEADWGQSSEPIHRGIQDFLRDKGRISSFLRESRHRAAQLNSGLEIAGRLTDSLTSGPGVHLRASVAALVARVTVGVASLKISIERAQLRAILSDAAVKSPGKAKSGDIVSFEVPFVPSDRTEITKLQIEKNGSVQPDGVNLKAVARAKVWFEQLTSRKAQSMAEIAARENITDNYVSNLIHLACLSPQLLDRVLDGEAKAAESVRTAIHSRKSNTLWSDQS